MRLLFLNALKGLRKKKIQMLGIIIMVMLSTAVYVGMNSAIDRLENKFYDYLDEQNVEDISVDVYYDYSKDVTIEMLDILRKNELSNVSADENITLDLYRDYLLSENREYDFILLSNVEIIFNKYGASYFVKSQILDSVKDKYNFEYELEKSKIVSDGDTLIKVLPYDKDGINRSYLIEGEVPTEADEITILPGYAEKNDIELGEYIEIGENKYKVVGFTYAPDYIFPIISFSMPIYNEEKNNIIYVNEEYYDSFVGVEENSFAITYNEDIPRMFELSVSSGEETEKIDSILFDDDRIMLGLDSVTRILRIGSLQLEFASDRLFAEYFMYLLLAISVVIISIITKKRIEDERLQIGVLKSLGYNRYSIATSYLAYPILGSLIGGLIGFIIGVLIHKPISEMLLSYFCVPLDNFSVSIEYLRTSVLIPMIVLSLLSYLIAIFMLRKKPLALLKEGSNLKVNIFSRICNKLTSFLPFESRFKYSLAFRSLGKLFIVTITSFCTGLLIVLVLIGMNLFNNVIEESFDGVSYKYVASMKNLESEKIGDITKTDYTLEMSSMKLTKIVDSNNIEKEVDDDYDFSFTGVDQDIKLIKILDKDNKNIITSLDEDGIIVNENARKILGLELDDTLTFTFENLEFNYNVVGFSSEYLNLSSYVDREALSLDLGFEEAVYNSVYSTDDSYSDMDKLGNEEASKISFLISFSDLKDNIMVQMDRFNGSIYFIVAFAALMVFIIIAVIASIVVEENKKTISLMKVMGYDDKKISKIILNIYTPFIIVAYLLSVPVMINILKVIVRALVQDIEMTIPISISPLQVIFGLLCLLIAYYVAIGLSKKSLKKVPLSIALKRE